MFGTDDEPTDVSSDDDTVSEETDGSTDANALRAAATSGTTKVVGELGSGDAIGVKGHATFAGSSADTCGVVGQVDADGNADVGDVPQAVVGDATGSGRTFGVHGRSTSDSATGVVGEAARNGLIDVPPGIVLGVYGYTDRDSSQSGVSFPCGVFGGTNTAGSGESYGVVGQVQGSDGPDTYAVQAFGDSRTSGNHETTGYQAVGQLGASVYLDSIQTIPDSLPTTVEFDTVVADDRAEWNGSGNHEFVCDTAGDYAVSTTIAWRSKGFSGETYLDLAIVVNGDNRALKTREIPGGVTDSGLVTQHVCKTLRNLSAGDAVSVEVRQTTGGSEDLTPGQADTYLTVDKVG